MIIVDADGIRWRPEDFVERMDHAVADGMAPGTAMEVLRTKLGGMSEEFYREQRERFETIAGIRDEDAERERRDNGQFGVGA